MSEENILKVDFSDEFQKSYIDYAMSVIIARAIPDVRDGLKPVQRRLLYAMDKLNIGADKATKKCARIVGDAMGKYHPHGDSSLYEALVVMSQPFKKIPLVTGQGNLGSIEGDKAAAQRYTEAKLEKITQETLLSDLNSTIDFIPNYDNTETEPSVLPSRLPFFLINGSEGIAVGMNTSTPTHNLYEICELCKSYLANQELSIEDMLKIMPGPDFPTGGIIANKKDLQSIYETGTGKIKIRGKLILEKGKNKREHDRLVVTEIPYTMIGVAIEKFMSDVASLVESKVLPEIIDISNQSNKDGIRIVFDLKAGYDLDRITNILYKKTKLEDTFGVNMLAIHNGRPEILSLKDILSIWYEFQKEILKRKYSSILLKLKDKKELQEGLIRACDCIDLIIDIIRGSKTTEDAKNCLVNGNVENISFKTKTSKIKASKLNFTEIQADSILKMQLQKLIGLEIDILHKSYDETIKQINDCNAILASESKMKNLIKKDLTNYQKLFGTKRKTEIDDCKEAIYEEKKEIFECYFLMDRFRYCKLIDMQTYERNMELLSEQYPYIVKTNSDSKVLLFTDKGLLYQVKCSDIPLCKMKDKGTPIENISSFSDGQNILYCTSIEELTTPLLFVTEKGFVKSITPSELLATKREIIVTKLNENDLLKYISPLQSKYLFFYTSLGYVLKINTSDIPSMKRNTLGVKGMDVQSGVIEEVYLTDNDVTINGVLLKSSYRSGKRGTAGKLLKKEA